ncbi:hypothetical protein BsIDN1_02960 [Bacillus safensis]|uniref:Beta-lactamase-related domain-containing protein n=1 Tax=Bacillus safensis TaxID=561879 RepID=A0A5S9M1X3_BACIA|nr:hypothetical protein BsIDN1_02960 [Bacillus safensis]
MEWMFGKYASNEAYGHTGWTGTMTLIDPKHNLGVVLLTNKKNIHPLFHQKQILINLKVTCSQLVLMEAS